jgi:hypothetical protein
VPFVSQAQRGFMYANHPKLAPEFEKATPKGTKLPRHVKAKQRSAPLPAANVSGARVSAPAAGKWLAQSLGQIRGLNTLRNSRLKTSGGFQP